jgi:glutamyl-Q tRNA(Asp) synthetase
MAIMRPNIAPSPVLRFAPSPNGALHLGHAYSALCNERLAAALGGRLLLRIEDLDRARSKPRYEAAILDDLAWLGVRFETRPRRQSEHGDDYAGALARLEALGLVYPCFCSRAEIARASAARDPDGAPLYPGTCRALSCGERADRIARGGRFARRLDMRYAIEQAPVGIVWREFAEGSTPVEHAADPAAWGDVVLAGRDLAASYHLAVTVDDALQGVTDVVRGRDLLSATSVHRLLQELLGLPSPRYRHHRLVRDAGGAKLSKSRASSPLGALREKGASAAQIRAALGFGGDDCGKLSVAIS